jgi:hypothetical protein
MAYRRFFSGVMTTELPVPCRCEHSLYFTFTAAGAMLISPYTCAAIVTRLGNLIKLFVNELEATTRGWTDHQEQNSSMHIVRMEHVVLQPSIKLINFT